MSKPIISVVTASSTSGVSCIKTLLEKYSDQVTVRGAYRSDAKAEEAKKEFGEALETVTGIDADKPETLGKAFEGATAALIVTPHDPTADMANDAERSNAMIKAAEAAGVKHITWVGSWTVNVADRATIIPGRFAPTEELLKNSTGFTWTILRGGYFAQNLLAPHTTESIKKGVYAAPTSTAGAPIDVRDIGRFGAETLAVLGKGHEGKIYEMSGPVRITPQEIAETFTNVLGKEVKFVRIPDEVFHQNAPKFLTELIDIINETNGEALPYSTAIGDVTGKHTTFEEFVRDHKSYFE